MSSYEELSIVLERRGYIALNRDGKVFYQTSRSAYTDHRWRPNRVEGYRYKLA